MTKEKLKPCPWCDKQVHISYWNNSNASKINNCGYDIECLNENCDFSGITYYYPLTKEQVIKKWNTRASDDALIECLKSLEVK